MWAACLSAELAAFLAAAWRYRRSSDLDRRQARPLLGLLAFAVVSDLVIKAGQGSLWAAPRPFSGWLRLWYHHETALILGWPATLCAVAWLVFSYPSELRRLPDLPREPGVTGSRESFNPGTRHRWRRVSVRRTVIRWIGIAWAVLSVGLAAAYPYGYLTDGAADNDARGRIVARVLLAAELSAVAGGAVAIWRAWGRPWGVPMFSVGALLASEFAVATIGPYLNDPYRHWDGARLIYTVAFTAIAVAQLWRAKWIR